MENKRSLIFEIFRYLLVGGLAFLVDAAVLIFFQEIFFQNVTHGIYYATALGFIAGLLFNYFLSIIFVFKNVKDKEKGKKISSFLIFALIGVIGLGITELGMYVGNLLTWHYTLVKCIMAAIVLAWNYIARKVIIFR